MHYPLASSSWDQKERDAIDRVLDTGMLSMGPQVEAFEQAFAEHFGSRYAVMSNSGSSANLLAVAALTLRQEAPLKPGDEVIVPAVSWGTTYFPFSQYGIALRFVDIDPDTLNIDPEQVEAAITPKTRAICAVNLLGNPCNLTRLQEICTQHRLTLIEDNCESMGALYQSKQCGTFGAMGTFSLYYSHHLCTIEGGVTVTDDEELYHLLLSLRSHGWTRHLPEKNHLEDKTGNSFYDAFRFVIPGYNLRPCEINAVLGLEQLKKLDLIIGTRRENAKLFQELFAEHPSLRIQKEEGESSWFGFSIVAHGQRDALVRELREKNIECRPIVAGNFTRNPVIDRIPHSIYGTLPHANEIHDHGFFLGNHPQEISEEVRYAHAVIQSVGKRTAPER